MQKSAKSREILPMQQSVLKIMTTLLEKGVAEEDIMEYLREIEMEYFSLLDKLSATEELSNIDTKTSLLKYNPDYLRNIVKTATRYREVQALGDDFFISYLRLDIDDFSKINNTYGHEFGDKILKAIADIIRSVIRPTDYAIRFGGEEFDIILPYTNMKGAEEVGKKVLKKIRAKKLRYKKETVGVTASIGVSQLSNTQVFADNACYDAKNSGKNTVRAYDSEKDYDAIRKEYAAKK